MIRGRLRRGGGGEGQPPATEEFVEIDAADLTGVFATPGWLRDVGFTAWLLVGVALFLVGAIWLLSLTHTIVVPVIAAGVIASVAAPAVSWLEQHHVPRLAGTILLFLMIVLISVGVFWLVVSSITSQTDGLSEHLKDAASKIENWLDDTGASASTAQEANQNASSSITDSIGALLDGVAAGVDRLASLVFFLAMTALSLIFLLADGPKIRAWTERHMGVPMPVARLVTGRTLQSLRGYFFGVTLVALFNGVVVGLGAVLLGVPLAGTIAVVTFLAAYIPYLGAWTAGAFSVLIALGGAGTDAAIGMIVVQLLANGVLQQLVQPLAMGAVLGIHPLAVLIVTIAAGALFGTVGLILGAPVTAAVVGISADLARARAEPEPAPG